MAELRGGPVHRIYSVVVFIVLASLDNVTLTLLPALYTPISESIHVAKPAIGVVTAVSALLTAVCAVGWAYYGDRTNRKPLLMLGTAIWAAGAFGSAFASGYAMLFAAQLVAAVGLGAVASVGFSVVSDLIRPKRRGLVMGFWGLSQGVGTLAGTLVAGAFGADNWRRPFVIMGLAGLFATLAYLFTVDIRRGASEPELAAVFEAGGEYEGRISRADLPRIAARRTNVWLVLQGVTAQVVFGSLVWLPEMFRAKAVAQGYREDTATSVGTLFAVLFQLGGVLSIVGGLIGDRYQRRHPGGRARVAAIGILGGIPLYLVLFLAPFKISVPDGGSFGAIAGAVLASVVTEPTVAVAFLTAVLALALTSANAPNWYALIVDVNPPEHRGTVYSLGNLANGVGRAVGSGLTGYVGAVLARSLAPPLNLAVGLAVFQIFYIPTGIMYWLASRTSPRDIADVHGLLVEHASAETAVRR